MSTQKKRSRVTSSKALLNGVLQMSTKFSSHIIVSRFDMNCKMEIGS